MRNIFVLFVMTLAVSKVHASGLSVKWFGATCLLLTDGEESLLFDPFFTRPSLWKVVSFKPLRSKVEDIEKWLTPEEVKGLSAILLTHSHYDHALDLVAVAKKNEAIIYGSESAGNIALGGGINKSRIKIATSKSTVKIGKFEIQILGGKHPPHLFNFTLASGKISKPLKPGASAYAYKKGEDFSFLISHPQGNIVFHPSADSVLQPEDLKGFKSSVVILGIANRKNSAKLIDQTVVPFKARTVIPVHFDNIFSPLHKPLEHLMGVRLKEFKKTASRYEGLTVKTLKFGEEFKF